MMLSGKVALVTGSSRGIGRAVAIALAKAGADVVVNYAGRLDAAQQTVDLIKEVKGRALLIKADVANTDQVKAMVDETKKEFGRLDILVNNAGITRDNLIMLMKDEDWDIVLNTNLKGVFNCCRAASRLMLKARAGRIINISSVVGLRGNPGQVNYAAAKAGITGLTCTLAGELGSRNITVNAIAPGFINTEMTAGLSPEAKERLSQRVPLKRLGTPEEIAGTVTFLCSPAAGYITGQVITVDGGMTAVI
ncbi:3-oxoacyl-[acyl-carrier-protein] reductase [Peptococcaceae bacterium]|nr:3-oxoacyl-[acyl-carrier-protein] reductase [Peptococcaceae bacterium]